MTITTPPVGTTTAVDGRIIEGICVPYGETSYLTPNPSGERVLPGAFTKSIQQQAGRVFLFRGHDRAHPLGYAISFEERPAGLVGSFAVRESVEGDQLLLDVRDGYLPAMSIGFKPVQTRRGPNGETEIVEAQLKEVSLLPLGAYDGAKVLAMRAAQQATGATMDVQWRVPDRLRHLLSNDAPSTRQPPFVARSSDMPAGSTPVRWHIPDRLRGLFGS